VCGDLLSANMDGGCRREGELLALVMVVVVSERRCSDESLSLPLRAPVCQQCRVVLPLASRAQGRIGPSRLSATIEVAEMVMGELAVCSRVDRVHNVGEARRTFGSRSAGAAQVSAPSRRHCFLRLYITNYVL
jgi:hypothetical protein